MQEDTGIVPKALANRPVLLDRWEFPKEVFEHLSGSRRYTANGPASIPISEYDIYAKGYNFSRLEWQETWEDVALIDHIWITEVSKKQQTQK